MSTLRLLATIALLSLIALPANADELDIDGLTKDQERAIRFCEDFAETVTSTSPDCGAMATALDELITRNETFVQRMATSDNDTVREECTLALEDAVEGLMVCSDSKDLNATLARLSAIEEKSSSIPLEKPPQASRTTRPELAQLQLFCKDLSTAVAEAPEDDCEALADAIDPVTTVHRGLFTRWSTDMDIDATEKKLFATAMAQCMEAMVSISERCQNNERVKGALRRLDE